MVAISLSEFKKSISDINVRIRDIRKEMSSLKWKAPPPRLNARSPKELHDLKKSLRKPETGPERAILWDKKRDESFIMRHTLLAYAYARGRKYSVLEKNSVKPVSVRYISKIIKECLPGEGSVLDDLESKINDWLQDIEVEPRLAFKPLEVEKPLPKKDSFSFIRRFLGL